MSRIFVSAALRLFCCFHLMYYHLFIAFSNAELLQRTTAKRASTSRSKFQATIKPCSFVRQYVCGIFKYAYNPVWSLGLQNIGGKTVQRKSRGFAAYEKSTRNDGTQQVLGLLLWIHSSIEVLVHIKRRNFAGNKNGSIDSGHACAVQPQQFEWPVFDYVTRRVRKPLRQRNYRNMSVNKCGKSCTREEEVCHTERKFILIKTGKGKWLMLTSHMQYLSYLP